MDGNSFLRVVPTSIRLGSFPALNWRRRAEQLQKQAYLFYFVFKHQRTAWYSRLTAACSAAYVLSPIQLIPNFIPVIGWLDDVLVLFVGAKILQKITLADVLAECRDLAEASCKGRKNEFKWAVIAPLILISAWLLVTLATIVFVAIYF
jgi:uncharacterized membrane protein YkvA (DUF1232 family)